VEFISERPEAKGLVPAAGNGFEVFLRVSDVVDLQKELAKFQKERSELEKLKESTEKKLANEGFLNNAPQEVVEKERGKLKEFSERIDKLSRYLEELT
jgi:valyl-tRNA synthetase